MINDIFLYLTPAYIATGTIIAIVALNLSIRLNYYLKFKKAGGVNTPSFASTPFTVASSLVQVARAHNANRLLEYWNWILKKASTAEVPHTVCINPIGGQRYLFTSEPEHIKTILTSKFAQYGKGPEFHTVWSPLLGDSIFTTDGKQWKDSREMLRPMFIKNRVSDLEIFEKWTQIMLKQFPAEGQTVDVQDLFYKMTIDVITEFLLGESVDSLRNPKSTFADAFGTAQRWQIMLTVLIPLEKFIPRGEYNRAIKVLDNFMLPIINRALALSDDEVQKLTKSDSTFTFLHAIAQYTRDPKVIRDQIIAVLLAGRDTTAATLSWTLGEVANNPTIWAKLREETLRVIGKDRVPTYDDLKGMKYLQNTLNEALRLYPAVPFNVRSALEDSTLPSSVPGQPDLTVVKGDAILYSTIAMQRRPELYPAVSETFAPVDKFSPERWENWQPKAWQYVPFNGGPRICVGQQFALVEMSYILIRMLQRYERVEYRGEDWSKQSLKVEIVGCPEISVKVAFFEDKSSK